MLSLGLNGGGGFGQWDGQAGREIGPGMEEAAIGGEAPDADELTGAAGERLGDETNAPVGRDDDVEGAAGDRRIERLAEMRVCVEVLDVRGRSQESRGCRDGEWRLCNRDRGVR